MDGRGGLDLPVRAHPDSRSEDGTWVRLERPMRIREAPSMVIRESTVQGTVNPTPGRASSMAVWTGGRVA